MPKISEPKRKSGRPTKEQDRREELWKARNAARIAVEAWAAMGAKGETMSQQTVEYVSKLSATDLALVVDYFPLAVERKKSNTWDFAILSSILRWDDPVVMLSPLVVNDPAGWWSVLGQVEEKPCSKSQEEIIRQAGLRLWQAGPVVADDPVIVVDFARFQENASERMK